jgi:sigma-B regulation protein RsbQ
MRKVDPIVRNNVTQVGNPDTASTLVFVHGFGTDQTAWADLLPAFQNDYRIVLLDNAGAGKSDEAAYVADAGRYLSLRGYAEDLVAVGEALDLKGATLIGHSVGAMISLLASNMTAGMFSKLVLLAGSPRYLDDTGYHGGMTREMIGDIHMAMFKNYQGWVDYFAGSAMGNSDRPHLQHYFAKNLASIPLDRAASALITIFESDCRANLAQVSIPTLIIQTRDDFAVPLDVANYLLDHIPHSRLSVIDATGHLPHISAPAEVIRALRDFGLTTERGVAGHL